MSASIDTSIHAGRARQAPRSLLVKLHRANSLVLVTAILVLLVIIATAFVVRSRTASAAISPGEVAPSELAGACDGHPGAAGDHCHRVRRAVAHGKRRDLSW